MCVQISLKHRTNEAKVYVESQKDRRGKLIQLIQVICCSLLLSAPGRAGAFSRDFTTILAPESRAFSGALKIEKLKAPLIPGSEGAVDTNDWCITMKQT